MARSAGAHAAGVGAPTVPSDQDAPDTGNRTSPPPSLATDAGTLCEVTVAAPAPDPESASEPER